MVGKTKKTNLVSLALVAAVSVLLLAAGSALAQTTWNGGSGDWQTGGNWSGGVPGNVVINDAGANQNITNAGGTISGFTWNQSSGAVSQVTLGSDLDVSSGSRAFNNTSGSAANMVLDLNGSDFRFYTTGTFSPMTIQTSSPGGTFTQGDGQFNASGMTIGAGVAVRGRPTYGGFTLYDNGTGAWDPASVLLGRVTGPEGGDISVGITASGSPRVGNVLLENGSLVINGGISIQNDLTMGVLSTTPNNYGYYAGIFNNTNNPNQAFRIGGNITDPNPNGDYAQGNYEADFAALRLKLDGGGNEQVINIAKSNVRARLEVTDDSHMKLANDFRSSYNPAIAGIIGSSLGQRSIVDVGTFDLNITHMSMYSPTQANAPTIIYTAGADSGSFHVDQLTNVEDMKFILEDDPLSLWADGDDFTLMSFNQWTGGLQDFSASTAGVTLPTGWTHDGVMVNNTDPGNWVLTNVQTNGNDAFIPEPTTLTLLLMCGIGMLVGRRR